MLRNNGLISKEEYVGKTIQEAEQYAKDGGFITRIIEIDGVSLMVTMDFKTNRVNFRVSGGYVTDVQGG